ncbi:uncharacterized protein BDZ99DRAFT_473039 [Mytilinidion resinicola]|uniref:MICOS complex subunit n=1 Tax=Mytilinidion resinicola TaxID=574789 RepID=A0A6A6YYI7_9PEZI|nr:uncharacterized protein BDZ99DRAFT_473039 [Mytilinidion resinicola]KAF2813891.1 hypothetical protein BDZ99DRAFT_473039 [Mytilinidion resinicola]
MAAAVSAGLMLSSTRNAHAEEPLSDDTRLARKPIYDDTPLSHDPTPTPSDPSTPSQDYRPTPTDRLAGQIKHARLAFYGQATKAEDAVNNALTKTLDLEHSFTSTIRGLAPPKESSEKLLPGAIYVLVASMAGSIVTRNRNILLRGTVPVFVGLGVAQAVIPITMGNVGELVWRYEKRFPAVADAHLKTRARIEKFIDTGKAHTQMSFYRVQDTVSEAREKMEDWVKKGK